MSTILGPCAGHLAKVSKACELQGMDKTDFTEFSSDDQASDWRAPVKFDDPFYTANGTLRASVALTDPTTLWFNTGTLCNIACKNCYIESTPRNDALVYISASEVEDFLKQLAGRNWPVSEIGFTGGEPFMNPEIIPILEIALESGLEVLVLTNAMRPMMRPRVQAGLKKLIDGFPGKLTLRISLDHFSKSQHDYMRGKGAFDASLAGMDWLRDRGCTMTVAGRTIWGESEEDSRLGYSRLFALRNYDIDPFDPSRTVLFPEIDESRDVPEISIDCWNILGKRPQDMMCASSRMVVKRKGAARPCVVACTLLPYEEEFELGDTLADAEREVQLNHPSCAQFCVLGGASCSRR